MSSRKKKIAAAIFLFLAAVFLVGIFAAGTAEKHETIKEVMRDAVLHEDNRINLFGFMTVSPALISAYTVTGIILVFALIVRLFIIPKFTDMPGPFQQLLELWVETFDNLGKTNSPHRNKALGAYLFAAGSYIFVGTCFELFGLQAITTNGHPIAMPAPLADINGAISMGVTSYLFILIGGVTANKIKGIGLTLKEFSLPISMSFRLFGALLSGALVTELVYYSIRLSFVLPVVVGVLFTLLHALIQAYVLTMLVSVFYGEVTEQHRSEPKKKKAKKRK